MRDAFERIAARGPAVVVLDDLQWADAATLELLPSLAEAAEEWALVFLGAYRDEEISRGHPLRRLRAELRRTGRLAELDVQPLDREATASIAGRLLGAEPGPVLRAALYDRTQGVPFLVEELAQALQSAGRLASVAGRVELEEDSSVPIPETLRDALRIRVESLSEEARATLEAAAVVGLEVELELLSDLGRDRRSGRGGRSRPSPRDRARHRRLQTRPRPGDGVHQHALAEAPLPASRARGRPPGPPGRAEADRRPLARSRREDAGTAAARRGGQQVVRAPRLSGRRGYRTDRARDLARRGGRARATRGAPGARSLCPAVWRARRGQPSLGEVVAGLAGGSPEQLAEAKQRLASAYELEGASLRATAVRLEAADAFEAAGRHAEAGAEAVPRLRGDLGRRADGAPDPRSGRQPPGARGAQSSSPAA